MDIFKLQDFINNLLSNPMYLTTIIMVSGIIIFYMIKKMIKISIILLLIGFSYGAYLYFNNESPSKILQDVIEDNLEKNKNSYSIDIANDTLQNLFKKYGKGVSADSLKKLHKKSMDNLDSRIKDVEKILNKKQK